MTPSAARGILDAIYWQPSIRWIIDRIHVLAPIRFARIGRNEVAHKLSTTRARAAMRRMTVEGVPMLTTEARQQRASTVLVQPTYLIDAHLEIEASARTTGGYAKHYAIFERRAARGQCFHQPCLGTREFAASFSLVDPLTLLPASLDLEGREELGFGRPRDLGYMVWDLDYQSEERTPILFRASLTDGILDVPSPGSDALLR